MNVEFAIPMHQASKRNPNSTLSPQGREGVEMLLWSASHGFHRGVWDNYLKAWRVMAYNGQGAFDEDMEPIYSNAAWYFPLRRLKKIDAKPSDESV